MLFKVDKGGMVHKSKLKGVTLAVLLALMPVAAGAAGLGRLTVTSGLGEPLSAEIELLSTTPDELASLNASIAPQEAYSVQGVERTALHGSIKVEVARRTDGTPVLKLSTRQAVSDPFLDMLIQVDWSTGRLLREYTVLLDPPGYNNNQAQVYNGVQLPPTPAAAPGPQAAVPAPANNANGNNSARNNAARKPTPAPQVQPQPQPASASHTTVRGDTLSAIAQQNQVEGVSLDQMLVGLYRANEDAFAGKNMNRLKVGQILRVPDATELQAISQEQANREVRIQSSDWNAYRNRLAGLAAESTASTDTSSQSASGRISAAATDQAAPADNGPRDVVKLSRSDAKGIKAEQDRLNALQEELTAKDKSLAEASERAAMLEKQISDMQKLLAIKNQSLANLQNNNAAPAPPVEAKPAEAPPAAEEKPEAEVNPPATEEPGEAPQIEPAAAPEAKKPAVVAPPPSVAEDTSLVDEVFGDDPLLPALAGGALVLLLGAWLFMRNKRKRELDSFEKGIQTSGGLKANTVFGNTAGATINTGDTSFLTDFSQNTGGMIDTHDVDPIAEAEVYMAYGRDAQAEEILKDAIVKEPQRHELHVKLLEIYAARNDASAFETVAGEIYTTLGASDPIWAKVAEMGHKLEPNNPLYTADRDSKPATIAAGTTGAGKLSASDFSKVDELDSAALSLAGAAVAGAAIANIASDQDAAEQEDNEGALDAGLTFEPALSTSSVVDDASASLPDLDFDIPATRETDAGIASGSVAKAGTDFGLEDNSMDFSLDLPEPAAKNSMQLDIAELDASIPDFDLPELSAAESETEPLSTIDLDAEEKQVAQLESGNAEVDFDLPELQLPEFELPAPEAQAESVATAGDELPTIDFDLPEISFDGADTDTPDAESIENASPELPSLEEGNEIEQAAGEIEEITLESPVEQNDSVPHFNFDDIDLEGGDSVQADNTATADELVLPEFDIDAPDDEPGSVADIDLSGISLDVADNPDAESLDTGSNAEESADVDTKLDLVTAYMDMGDNEGARELLEEILQEGGPNQKRRAQAILDDLA
ncbi:LysM peptidoglycan-binding domain-containing protein [Methylobacillus caricis]|uniref:FimV/HubP family polar landmark protein n=1 Tax=Methylobacillus caricis TaxID=1971611 RepID=UPI001CFF91C1|nr:FimV/HubP family polar landmark protein [Methylobacillus caricis]MCB5187222.1 LysM peptidoglycan-binding domain-containing protein [Methylobacillus caricis]